MSLTILSVAFPHAPVRDNVAGGAEQVLLALDRSLSQAGQRSVVVAAKHSVISGELVAADPEHYRDTIAAAIRTVEPDIVHYHGLDFQDYLVPSDIPSLITLHMPAEFYRGKLDVSPGLFYHCVSESQRARFPSRQEFLPTIENGVDTLFFGPGHGDRKPSVSYVVSLGRICPEKGFHLSLDAALEAGVAMLLAGETFPYPDHLKYMREQIEPRIDRSRRCIGSIGRWKKRSLLTGAQCLVIPSLVHETSSLVAMEALACGTPVVARPVGALPDIVEEGLTGWFAETSTEMASAIRRSVGLDRRACRRAAEARFSQTAMANRYFETYELLARQTCSR